MLSWYMSSSLLGLPSGSPKSVTLSLTAAQETQLTAGQLYVTVATSAHPAGELRGQLDALGPAPTGTLTVSKAGPGNGQVIGGTEVGFVLDCGVDCDAVIPDGRAGFLLAFADPGSVLLSWSGCDTIENGACKFTMAGDRTVTVTFAQVTSFSFPIEGWQVVAPYVPAEQALQGQASYDPSTRTLAVAINIDGVAVPLSGVHLHGPAARGAIGPLIAPISFDIAYVTLTQAEPDGRVLRVTFYSPQAGESEERTRRLFGQITR